MKSFLLPAACLLAATSAFAQNGSIDGNVTDEKGVPVVGAVMGFDRMDYQFHREVKTDKKGHYILAGVAPGDYNYTVTIDGILRDRGGQHISLGIGSTDPLNIKLKPLERVKIDPTAAKTLSAEDKKAMDKAQEDAEASRKNLMDAFNAGKTALESKNYDEAIDNLTKATVADPKQSVVWGTLAEAYLGRAGKPGADKKGDQDKGFSAYQKAIELKPDDAGNYNNYATKLGQAGRIDEARAALAKASQIDPPSTGKYNYNLGVILMNSGRNDDAIDQFKKTTDADPAYADAWYQYGIALAGRATLDPTGKMLPVPGTVEALQKYIALKPEGPYVPSAKELLAAMNSTVETSYKNPAAKQTPAKKK